MIWWPLYLRVRASAAHPCFESLALGKDKATPSWTVVTLAAALPLIPCGWSPLRPLSPLQASRRYAIAEALKMFHRQHGSRLSALAVKLLGPLPEEVREEFPALQITYSPLLAGSVDGDQPGAASGGDAAAADPDADGSNAGAAAALVGASEDASIIAVEKALRRRKGKRSTPKRLDIGGTLMKRPYLVVPVLEQPKEGRAPPPQPAGAQPAAAALEGNTAALESGLALDPVGLEIRRLEAMLGSGFVVAAEGGVADKEKGAAAPAAGGGSSAAARPPSRRKSKPRRIVTEVPEAGATAPSSAPATPPRKKGGGGVKYEDASPRRSPRSMGNTATDADEAAKSTKQRGRDDAKKEKKEKRKGKSPGAAEPTSSGGSDDEDRKKRSRSRGRRPGEGGRGRRKKSEDAAAAAAGGADGASSGDENRPGHRSKSGQRRRSPGKEDRQRSRGKVNDAKRSYRSSGDGGSRRADELALQPLPLARRAAAGGLEKQTTGKRLAGKLFGADAAVGGRVERLLLTSDERRLEKAMLKLSRSTRLDIDRPDVKVTYTSKFIVSVICTTFYIWTGAHSSPFLLKDVSISPARRLAPHLRESKYPGQFKMTIAASPLANHTGVSTSCLQLFCCLYVDEFSPTSPYHGRWLVHDMNEKCFVGPHLRCGATNHTPGWLS